MAKSYMGARVQYCGHNGYFVADVYLIEGVNVIIPSLPKITTDNLIRDGSLGKPTHHLVDFPKAGAWLPHRGVFAVPQSQMRELRGEQA